MPTRDPRPTKVKIGPQTYNIEYRYSHEDGMLSDGSHGYTLDQGNLIVIANELSVGKQKVCQKKKQIMKSGSTFLLGYTKMHSLCL